MDIVVCIKRVPDVAEADVEIDRTGLGIDESDLSWGMNEWDTFAVEEALRLKEEHGGTVTALTVGGEDDEEVLRRALAMGADQAVLLQDDAFAGSDPLGVAKILAAAIRGRPYDLVLTGAVSGDTGSAQLGGMLAALLEVPQVALATRTAFADGKLEVQHEVEGGLERVVELDLPAVVTVQTGINQPRYVSIRGIRKVASVEIPVEGAGDLGLEAGALAAQVTLKELFLPPTGDGAEILEGSTDEVVEKLVERLRERGGI